MPGWADVRQRIDANRYFAHCVWPALAERALLNVRRYYPPAHRSPAELLRGIFTPGRANGYASDRKIPAKILELWPIEHS
jgi:hypothetical protein